MKIVFIGGRDVHAIGGIESYTRNLSLQLVSMGHEVTVFCESAYEGYEDMAGVKVIHQRSIPSPYLCKPLLGLRATLRVILGLRDADVIHYNAWPPALWSPLARLFGIHSIMEGHGLEWKNTKYNRFERKLIHIMEGITAFTNRRLVMCSDSQTRYFLRRYGRQCFTLGSGTFVPRGAANYKSNILHRFGLQPGKYFLLMSRLVSVKSPDTLITAFCKLNDPDFRLVLAGEACDPSYDTYLRRLAAKDPRVIFAGSVFDDDAECLMREAYAYCNPSSSEGLCITLLEAMARRVPVIVSDIDGNREVLTDDTAMWFTPRNTESLTNVLRRAIDDPQYLRRGIEANCELVNRSYQWPIVARHYEEYLKTLPHICRKYGYEPHHRKYDNTACENLNEKLTEKSLCTP